DIAGDRLRTQRRTTAGERRWQIADSLDLHRRPAAAASAAVGAYRVLRLRGLDQPLRRLEQLCHGDLPFTERLVEVIGIACLQLTHESGQQFGSICGRAGPLSTLAGQGALADRTC